MTSCSHPARLVPLLYDDELNNAQRREVAFQIADCPVCTRRMNALERTQETLRETLDEEVAQIDFSNFWAGVEQRLEDPPLARWSRLSSRLRLWRVQWQATFSWHVPVWAVTTALLIITTVVLTRPPAPSGVATPFPEREPVLLASNNQAQIEALSATSTVLVWNEPTSNATVIWVDEAVGGDLP